MSHKSMTVTEFLAALGAAVSGLLFPSESDYPLTPYRWVGPGGEDPSPKALLTAEGRPPDTKVTTLSVHELFDPLIDVDNDRHDDEERAAAVRYRALVSLLEENLCDLVVYRVGQVDIDVYILGMHPSGEWLGLKTRVIET